MRVLVAKLIFEVAQCYSKLPGRCPEERHQKDYICKLFGLCYPKRMSNIIPAQCRSARAWLEWSQTELAEKAKVGLSTVKDFENGKRTPIQATLGAMRSVLEAEGIGFPFALDGGVTCASGITYSRPKK